MCQQYREASERLGITLSVHASYFIVLTSDEEEKVSRSIDTLKKTYELAEALGSRVVVLHPGPLYGKDPLEVGKVLRANISRALAEIGPTDIGLYLETAGKKGQYGSVDEVLDLSDQLKGVYPCIDFGHVHARENGSLTSLKAVRQLFECIRSRGYFGVKRKIHMHYSPVKYGPRGELCHKKITDLNDDSIGRTADLFSPRTDRMDGEAQRYSPSVEHVAACIKEFRVKCTLISETLDSQEEGALALKRNYCEHCS
jgi:deoxyribonuclease-4